MVKTSSPERLAPALPAAPEAAVLLPEPPQAARPMAAAAAPAACRNERREIFFMMISSPCTKVDAFSQSADGGVYRFSPSLFYQKYTVPRVGKTEGSV